MLFDISFVRSLRVTTYCLTIVIAFLLLQNTKANAQRDTVAFKENFDTKSNRELCPDLKLTRIEVLSRTRNTVRVGYSMVNIGDKSVLLPAHSHESPLLTIAAFWSGDSKYSGGDIEIRTDNITNFGAYGYDLPPDGVYEGEMTLPLEHKSSFTNNLILLVDARFWLQECDEQNNVGAVLVP